MNVTSHPYLFLFWKLTQKLYCSRVSTIDLYGNLLIIVSICDSGLAVTQGKSTFNPITYGILTFRQLRGGEGRGAFWPKQGYS